MGGRIINAQGKVAEGGPPQLISLVPANVMAVLDLGRPGLEGVRAAAERGGGAGALAALRAYYRERFPLGTPEAKERQYAGTADQIVERVFQWAHYPPARYGEDMDWDADPAHDIEWVAVMHRFNWAPTLAHAFAKTRDEKYARTFVELATDWILKHRLEDSLDRELPGYGRPGFAWLDIQTGIRAHSLCQVFPVFIHADAFTPEFLGLLLASLHDHQIKSLRIPKPFVHNKSMMEIRGIAAVAATFPEFRESRPWLEEAGRRAEAHLFAQTTDDGVQTEWCGGYHLCVLRDGLDILDELRSAGLDGSKEYVERLRLMTDYLLAMATPDLGFPIFGDTKRSPAVSTERSSWPLHGFLEQASERWGDAKYAARANLDEAPLPEKTSYAFTKAGHYVLRDRWGPDQIYMALHCTPPSLQQTGKRVCGHDAPDNGTFELYAFGRWLMTDTGHYVYGNCPEADERKWHRLTRNHQTLTLDGEDAWVQGRALLWRSDADGDLVVMENESYPGLVHRRTVWFVNREFFVFLDEAIGDAQGELGLHFQFAPGEVEVNADEKWARTCSPDTNVLVWQGADAPVAIRSSLGWTACEYGRRERRTAVEFAGHGAAPAVFLTMVVPYRGETSPAVAARMLHAFVVGDRAVEVDVTVAGRSWRISRDLAAGK